MSAASAAPDHSSPPFAEKRSSTSRHAPGKSPAQLRAPAQHGNEVTPKSLSQTGRSRTVPLNIDTLWMSPTQPQLSERDSIFATNYIHTNSPSTSPDLRPTESFTYEGSMSNIPDIEAATMPSMRRLVEPSLLRNYQRHPPSPPSSIPIQLERRLLNDALGRHDQKGYMFSPPRDDQSLPNNIHIQKTFEESSSDLSSLFGSNHSPFDSPPSPPPGSPHSARILEDNEERLKYRSWREGKATLSTALKPTSSVKAVVARKIEAALPKPDQPVMQARSRKASHYLGLFKGEQGQEEQKRREERLKERSVEDRKDGRSLYEKNVSPKNKGQDNIALDHVQSLSPAHEVSTSDAQMLHCDRPTLVRSPSGEKDSVLSAVASPNSVTQPPVVESTPSFPIRLLEEIRNHHNITPGAERGTSFSRSLPTTVTERSKRSTLRSDQRRPRESDKGYFPPIVQGPHISLTASEDEESEHEQISSALYYPHRQISPDKTEQDTRDGDALMVAPDLARQATVPPNTKERSVSELSIPENPTADEIEIALKSQADEQVLHGDIATLTPDAEDDAYTNDTASASDSEQDLYGDSVGSPRGYESSATDDLSTTPKASALVTEHKVQKGPHPPAPIGAVELKPFDHQVGGHTTIYRFSRRAVCKQLNNRENEFYETVERFHAELLEFMPRYIGVLNVTYRRRARRKKSARNERKVEGTTSSGGRNSDATLQQDASDNRSADDTSSARIVSHSQSQRKDSVPQVVFENNRHIIPADLFRVPPRTMPPRSQLSDPSLLASMHKRNASDVGPGGSDHPDSPHRSITRPPVRHHSSWGATTVNRKLQEQVLREVFTPPTIHHHYKSERNHHGSLPNRRLSRAIAGSAPSGRRNSADVSLLQTAFRDESTRRQAMNAAAQQAMERAGETELQHPIEEASHYAESYYERIGMDIPDRSDSSSPRKYPRRRHSGGGLRRRAIDVETGKRSHLEFHEQDTDEDAYRADCEDDVFPMEKESPTPGNIRSGPSSKDHSKHRSAGVGQNLTGVKSDVTIPGGWNLSGNEPMNPDQAQTQSDERVEHFLLLEDLTSGMNKPCVLDLKMGTRQYGVEADEKKQRSQRRKCKMTTSRELGVRVCGMQVYNIKTQSYLFEDKYFGRDLKAGKEFQDALKRFFYDGIGYISASRHIPVILEKIDRLERMIRRLPSYRFYASSLLMLYDRDDGSLPPEDGQTLGTEGQETMASNGMPRSGADIKLKIVDFANCVTAEDKFPEDVSCPPQDPNGIDRGYLRGLRSLRMYFQRIWEEINEKQWVERGEGEGMSLAVGQRSVGHGVTEAGWEDAPVVEEEGYVSI
ncbi:SAICAR synthase-like protein [Pseudovirgaria hyperparasitica]|uniref:Kinase n=1 Tax=Pseudovirgaria hyperparasitica TaxID=470096 RepID=A0A6A6WHZ0_9PEZI|nr:SAICAR synthase-like protein [Pseudovirgaria hyperparasitica]KAF2761660.1 SAICAR synthase-like protein [Pseudovirgaria hyperparasitica]